LAAQAQPMPQGGPPQGGPPAGAQQQAGQIIQLMQIISQASSKLGEIFPAGAPMTNAIQNQLQQIQSKVAETQRPTQPQAPPI
jgi:hypothetical protein